MNTVIASHTFLFLLLISCQISYVHGLKLTMSGWSSTWDDIASGGNPRWKVTDLSAKASALGHITKYAHAAAVAAAEVSTTCDDDGKKLNIVCPLAGDDGFVHHAWSQGHSMTAIELVPRAVEEMRRQFSDGDDDCWQREDRPKGMVLWKHKSGTVSIYQGDVFTPLTELDNTFDAVYDKDSFGALDLHMRSPFCARVGSYLKPGVGIVYTEVKYSPGRTAGPPFHVEKEDLLQSDNFGSTFEYVADLGELYQLNLGGFKQTGHILKRLSSKL